MDIIKATRVYETTSQLLYNMPATFASQALDKISANMKGRPELYHDNLVKLCADYYIRRSSNKGTEAKVKRSLTNFLTEAHRCGAGLSLTTQTITETPEVETTPHMRENASALLVAATSLDLPFARYKEQRAFAVEATALASRLLQQPLPLETPETQINLCAALEKASHLEPWGGDEREKKIASHWHLAKKVMDNLEDNILMPMSNRQEIEQETINTAFGFYTIGLRYPLKRIPMMDDIFSFVEKRADVLSNGLPTDYSADTNDAAVRCLSFFVEYGHKVTKDFRCRVHYAQEFRAAHPQDLRLSMDKLAKNLNEGSRISFFRFKPDVQ